MLKDLSPLRQKEAPIGEKATGRKAKRDVVKKQTADMKELNSVNNKLNISTRRDSEG